jgi:hypothetical protein
MNFFHSLPHRRIVLDGPSATVLVGPLHAVAISPPVRAAAQAIAAQFGLPRDKPDTVFVRVLPGGGIEMILISPASRTVDVQGHGPDVTVVSDSWQDENGSCVLIRVHDGDDVADVPLGVIEHGLGGSPISGDGWSLSATAGALTLLVIDGLGHGPLAQNAAKAAVEAARELAPVSPSDDLRAVHAALKATVGAAGAVARLDATHKTVDFCGLGNIEGSLVIDSRRSGLASYPGVVGQGLPTFRTSRHLVPDKAVLVMHTDGVRPNWSPSKYQGLFHRHPALIAGVLFRDCWRQSDDALIVVIDVSPKTQTMLAALSL